MLTPLVIKHSVNHLCGHTLTFKLQLGKYYIDRYVF